MININFTSEDLSESQAIAVFINEQLKIDNPTMLIDQHCHGLISKTIQSKKRFVGKFSQIEVLTSTSKDGQIKYLILVGIGDEGKLESSCIEELGGKILATATSLKTATVSVKLEEKLGKFEQNTAAALIGSGAMLASYKFDKYITKQTEEDKFSIESFEILTTDVAATDKLFAEKKAVLLGIFFARDLINEPANILYPESYAEKILEILEPLGVEIEVLGEREMRNLNMGALLGVGQGSQNESKLVVMKYNGTDDEETPVAFVGKGVTFDTGGICLKPSAGMADMKYDMSGSAAVVGTIQALALRKAKVNVVGVIGLVENMPSGNAQRPGDIVTTMSGQTAEVIDTDAEGRLVLADAIWYAQEQFRPKCVIDLATLTGAIVVALGHTYAGLFANNDELADRLSKAGDNINEKLWRMPLHKDFDEMIKSEVADVANLGNVRGAAGSSTAAHFIGRFIKEGVAWAHLDIAGVAWEKKGTTLRSKGAVGYGIKLLNQFVQDYYETK